MDVKIYPMNLAKYNQGKLVGKWLELPLTDEDLNKELGAILGNDEEYFIADYEAPFQISAYCNLFELNEFVEQLKELDESQKEQAVFLINYRSFNWKEALEKSDEVTFYQGMSLEDVAAELVDEGVYGELNNTIKYYIDYTQLAYDLSTDGYFETENGTFWYQ
jgi:hypothetical protein